MDLNQRSTGYEPVGISWLPYPAIYDFSILILNEADPITFSLINFVN